MNQIPPKVGTIPPFNMIGWQESLNITRSMKRLLSGYIGGVYKGGYWVERLAAEWSETFDTKYSIPCNSATSGLLAACMAAGVTKGTKVWTTAYTMSATAACALLLGADVTYWDIEKYRFSINPSNFPADVPDVLIVTNLFGCPAYLAALRSWANINHVIMIEDNAQAPFAVEGRNFTGTIGHMGVFSLNVHKHIQAGEGGVVVTDDPVLAQKVYWAVNHGELSGGFAGLNLRMTETTAAIASAQLARGYSITENRRELAFRLNEMVRGCPFISAPREPSDCRHVYYMWAARVYDGKRDRMVNILNDYGFPIRAGYSKPLNRIFNASAKGKPCPVAEELEDKELMTFEVCAWDPKASHLKKMRDVMSMVIELVA